MPHDLPESADFDALRKLVEEGSDLDRPMCVNFHVAVPSKSAGDRLAEAARKLGYCARVYASRGCSLPWTCECSTRMLATPSGIAAFEAELSELALPLGGFPDGWGTFGNKPEAKS